MENITIKINGVEVSAPAGSTILEAARLAHIDIPTLCYLKEINEIGACRMCIVEVKGARSLVASCVYPINPGMEVWTNTPKVIESRKKTLELLLSNHKKECLSCVRSGNCELQQLCKELGVEDQNYYDGEMTPAMIDTSAAHMVRDNSKCILCRRCSAVCEKVQGIGVIGPNERGFKSYIGTAFNMDLADTSCVSCGQCMVSCPFGAIADKSQIFQLIRAMQSGRTIIAQVAPAFAGQFGPKVTPEMFKTALKELGFADVYETALGADMGCMAEAEHYVKEVATGKQQFALTSCCPSWSVMAKNLFPETIDKISNELTPMVATARLIKQEHPDASVVFIGPCASKKLEASRRTVRSDVDFVITFEELTGMFEAKGILLDEIKAMDEMKDATSAGRGYGVAGGVANAIKDCIEKYYPGTPVNIQHAESLAECKKALLLAKAGKMNGCLIEGMACPGGCIAGAGTNIAIPVAARAVDKFKNEAEKKVPDESVDQEMVELEKE